MYEFEYVAPVAVVSPNGSPMMVETEDGAGKKTLAPFTSDQLSFLLERTVDPAFAEGMRGMEAQEFISDFRDELRKQDKQAASKGRWLVEDAPAKRLKKSVEQGNYAPAAFNHISFMRAVVNMKKVETAPVEDQRA